VRYLKSLSGRARCSAPGAATARPPAPAGRVSLQKISFCFKVSVEFAPPPPPHTTNSSGTPVSADSQSAGPANTGPGRTATEDKGRVSQSFIVGVNHPCVAPTHLQSLPYCNTIARPVRNIRLPSDPLFVCHTPYSPPSLHHFVMQDLLPPVVVLGCGFSFARVWLCEDL